jgi:uncharacterized repeat protein (TIGR03833 family)
LVLRCQNVIEIMKKSEVGKRKPEVGERVNIVQKQHYETGQLTTGTVGEVLTKSRYHSRGHKVRLESGIIGRVQSFVDEVGEQEWVEGKESVSTVGADMPVGEHALPSEDDLR